MCISGYLSSLVSFKSWQTLFCCKQDRQFDANLPIIDSNKESAVSSSDEDYEIKMDFKEKKTKTKKKDEPTGIMNMKFMKTAE